MALGFPKNEPHPVPGKGLDKGGKVEGLQHMHMRADEMATHDHNVMKTNGDPYPASPAHENTINLENAASRAESETAPENCNMQAGLGPVAVPGKGLV